jgi:putative ABC transport system permease protein
VAAGWNPSAPALGSSDHEIAWPSARIIVTINSGERGDFMRIRQALGFWRYRPAAAAWIMGTLATAMAGVVMLTSLCVRVLTPRLPMTDENHLVRVGPLRADSPSGQFFSVDDTVDEYGSWQARQHVFPVYAAFTFDHRTFVHVSDGVQSALAMRVTKDFFTVTGTRAERGRLFVWPADLDAGAALVTNEAATRLFGAASEAIGSRVDLWNSDDSITPVTIVGILPRGFGVGTWKPAQADTPQVADFILPMRDGALPPDVEKHVSSQRYVLARLPPHMDTASAAAQLHAQCGAPFAVTPLPRVLFGRTAEVSTIIAWGALGLGLLALVNALGVAIAVELERRADVATRRCLGATNGQLARQCLLEGAVIAAATAAIGLALAELVMRLTAREPAFAALDLGRMTIGAREMAATAGVAGAFWLGRMMVCLAVHGGQTLYAQETTPTVSRRTRVSRASLIAIQVGIALALLLGTEVAASSAAKLLTTDLGFDPRSVLTVEVSVPSESGDRDGLARYRAYLAAIDAAADEAPGGRVVGLATDPPLFASWSRLLIPVHRSGPLRAVGFESVTPGYFRALGARLEAGDLLRPGDPDDAVVVNEPFAATYFGDPRRAVGQLISYGAGLAPARIVGVVRALQQTAVGTTPKPTIYASFSSSITEQMSMIYVVTRERGDVGAARRALASAIRRVAPGQYVNVTPLSDRFWHQTAATNAGAAILVSFAIFAVGLMAGGLHGVLAQVGASRAREFATRQALGARPGHVVVLMLKSVLAPVGWGVIGGATVGIWATRVLQHVFPDAWGASVPVYGVAIFVTGVVALASCWGPARRAGQSDIVRRLRAL